MVKVSRISLETFNKQKGKVVEREIFGESRIGILVEDVFFYKHDSRFYKVEGMFKIYLAKISYDENKLKIKKD